MELPADELIGGFATLRQDNQFDVTLQTEGKSFSAHRALLASASQYFRAMFGGNFKEANDDLINLEALGVSSNGLSAIVDSLYSLKLNITRENLVVVTETANILQFTSIVTLCEKYLQDHLDIQNCIQILQLCEEYCLKSTKHAVDLFLLENLIPVSEQNPEYVEISKETVIRFIADTKLSTNDEIEVYRAVMKWIKFTPSRDEHIAELLQHVRMHYIPLDVITDEIVKEPAVEHNEECVKQVKDAIEYHNSLHKQPLFKTLPPRGELAVLLAKDVRRGKKFKKRKKKFQWYLKSFPSSNKSIKLTGPYYSGRDIIEGCEFLGNFAFFMSMDYKEWRFIRYDPILDKCLTLAPVPIAMDNYDENEEVPTEFLFEAVEDVILLGGGFTCKENGPILGFSKCYMYSIEQNTWKQTVDLPEKLANPLACVHNNHLYITSYEIHNQNDPNDEYRKILWMFDPKEETWSKRASSFHIHADSSGVNGKIP